MRRATLSIAVVSLVLLAGCSLTVPNSDTGENRDSITLEPRGLDDDRPLGEVNGYTPTDTFEIDESDGVTETELEAIKYRSMARIEELRGRAFQEDVTFEVVTQERYQEDVTWTDGPTGPPTNEVWRAAFVVDGETDVNEALEGLYGTTVLGYYANDRFVLVVDDLETIRVDRTTLVHELVHALQDQHVGLSQDGETIDEQRSQNGLFEGEAEFLPSLYDERCGEGWECLGDRDPSGERDSDFNVGLFLSVYAPYATGPGFVDHRYDDTATSTTDAWAGVDAAYDDQPTSTEQLIHPERYPDVEPVDVPVEDRSSGDWEPFTVADDGAPRTETVGEATLFASLFVNGVIDRELTAGAPEYAPYNYSHPITDGWAGDSLVTYHDADDEERTGHVWRLAWKTEEDATAFHDAYVDLLESRGAEEVTDGTYRISDGDSFAGAYRVTLEGDDVTIVGGPTVDSLADIHGSESGVTASTAPVTSPTTVGPTATARAASATG